MGSSRLRWIFGCLAACSIAQLEASAAGRPPNLVLLLADDMGWGDLGVNIPGVVSETPHLDRLAERGVRFTDMHSGASMCTPARAALLTGRIALRTGVVENFGTLSLHGLNVTEITLSSLLHNHGYDTMALGKWHLGHAAAYQPLARGFDHFLGIPYSWDMGCADGQNGQAWYDNYCSAAPFRLGCPTWWGDEAMCQGAQAGNPAVPLLEGHRVIEQPANLSALTHRLDSAAEEFIALHRRTPEQNNSTMPTSAPEARPFFLYYAMPHMHAPQAFLPEFLAASATHSPYGASLRELDNSVHRVWQALEHARVLEDDSEENGSPGTLVIFSSDNGPWNIKCNWRRRWQVGDPGSQVEPLGGDQGPFLGAWQRSSRGGGGGDTGKFTVFEGGHRVPALAWWPGVVLPGSVISWPASHLDLLPTLLAAAETPLPTDRAYDGINLLPYLGSPPGKRHPPRRALFHIGDPSAPGGSQVDAVRLGPLKVFFRTCAAAACGESYYTCAHLSNETRVFDLDVDPAESSPIPPSSPKARAATAEAFRARAALLETIEPGLFTGTNFSSGAAPSDWVCCDPENLSCRCSTTNSLHRSEE